MNLQSLVLEPRGKGPVGGVRKDEVGLARVHAHFQNALPNLAGGHAVDDLARGRVTELPRVVRVGVAHRGFNLLHEGGGDVDAVVEIQGLHVLVARGLAHLDELNDVGVAHVEERSIRAAARGTLAVGEARSVVDLEVRENAHRLFIGAADPHVDAYAAPEHREPVHFGERVDEPLGAVFHVGEEARNRQTALSAAERKNRRREGEPVAACIVVNSLRVLRIAREMFSHEGKALLRTFFLRTHVAFAQAHESEFVKERVPARINLY